MISKIWMRYMVVFIVLLITVTHYVRAETYESVITKIDIPAYGTVDESWNAMNETSRSNEDTWNPRPEGLFVGSIVPECLFQANELAGDNAYLFLMNEFKFNSAYTMSGISQFVVRLPVYTEESSWNLSYLKIYSIDEDTTYEIQSGAFLNFTGKSQLTFSYSFYTGDETVSADNDCDYTIDHRTYVIVNAPIVPNQVYLFVAKFTYFQDAKFKWYYSVSDVASDNYTKSTFCIYYNNAPDVIYINEGTIDVDMGWSFVFQKGMASGISGINHYFYEDDEIRFYTFMYGSNNFTNKALSIMIPFFIEDGSGLNVTVIVKGYDNTERINVTNIYHDFILNSSSLFSYNHPTEWYYNWWTIRIIFNENKRVKFCMFDLKDKEQNYATADGSNADLNSVERFFISNEGIGSTHGIYYWFMLQHSLRVDNAQWEFVTPHIVTSEWYDIDWSFEIPKIWVDILAVGLIIGGIAIAVITLGGGIPISIAMTATAVGLIAAGSTIAIINNWDKIQPYLNQAGNVVKNALDWVWDRMVDFGKWLWRMGVNLYGFIRDLIPTIQAFTAVLLGIIIAGVGVLIFYAIIGGEINILQKMLFLAQGRFEEAGTGMVKEVKKAGEIAVGAAKGTAGAIKGAGGLIK